MNTYTLVCLLIKSLLGVLLVFYTLVLLNKIKLAKVVDELNLAVNNVIRKRALLSNVATDYYHSIDTEGVKAILELDRLILHAEGMLEFAQNALTARSKKTIRNAYNVINDFKGKQNLDLNNADSSWESKVNLLLHKVCDKIMLASKKAKKLNYPSASRKRQPTEQILQEILSNRTF